MKTRFKDKTTLIEFDDEKGSIRIKADWTRIYDDDPTHVEEWIEVFKEWHPKLQEFGDDVEDLLFVLLHCAILDPTGISSYMEGFLDEGRKKPWAFNPWTGEPVEQPGEWEDEDE
jgi:hypothetical protein